MALTLSSFARGRERMGVADEAVALPDDVRTVADLIAWLAARDDRGGLAFAEPARIRAAVDGQMVGPDAIVVGVAEIALFPPVTGG